MSGVTAVLQLVATQLSRLERLAEYERQCASTPRTDAVQELEVRRSIWRLYAGWAADADNLLSRALLAAAGDAVEGLERLDQAIGSVRARLSVAPERTAAAVADARHGRVISAQVLRHELRPRHRA